MTSLMITALFIVAQSTVGFSASATKSKTPSTAPTFELCFAGNHGRCFRTERAGMFRQYGGLSDSEAFLPETEQRRLHKEITTFFSKVEYAKAKKVKSCTNPFVFRQLEKMPPVETYRCLERLKKKDSDLLLSLVAQISLASKPL